MAMNTSTFPALLDVGIRDLFGVTYEEFPVEYTQFFDVLSSTMQSEDFQELYGFDLFTETGEDVLYPLDEMGQGYSKTIAQKKFSKRYKITEDMLMYGQYNYINNRAVDLANSARETQDTTNIGFLNSYATETAADGVALLSTAHKCSRGGGGTTYGNRPTTPSGLSETSIQNDWINVGKMKDPAGRKKNYTLKKLLVPRDLYFTAMKLMESGLTPGSNQNAINTVKSGKVVDGYMTSNYLTDASVYFYRTNIKGLVVIETAGIQFDQDQIKNKGVWEYFAKYRQNVGCTDARSIFGNGMAS